MAGMVVWGLVLAGVVLRVAMWGRAESYWADEAYLLLNLMGKGWWEVAFGPLDLVSAPQAAPPVFCWLVKGAEQLWGRGEWAVRGVPMVMSVLAVAVYPLVARRVMSPWAVVVTTAVMAVSPRLVLSAGTLKQYAGDVLVAELVLLAALGGIWGMGRMGSSPGHMRRLAWATGVATVGTWVSHPTVFVFSAVAATLIVGGKLGWRGALVTLPAWVSIGVVYFASARVQADPFFFVYWSDTFVPWERWWTIPWFVLKGLWGQFDHVGDGAGVLLFAAVAVGVVAARGGDLGLRLRLAMLAGAVGVVLLAGAVWKYPFTPSRLTLFLIPVCLLLGGMGLDVVGRWWGGRGRWLWAVLGVTVAMSGTETVGRVAGGGKVKDVRAAIEFAHRDRSADERVFVLETPVRVMAEIYKPEWGADASKPAVVEHVLLGESREVLGGPGGTRFWVILSSVRDRRKQASRELADLIDQIGVPVDLNASLTGARGEALRFTVPEGEKAVVRGAYPFRMYMGDR